MPEPLVDQVTLPVGVGLPKTIALQMVTLPTTTDAGLQKTVTDAGGSVTVIEDVPLLGSLFRSPRKAAVRETGPRLSPVTVISH